MICRIDSDRSTLCAVLATLAWTAMLFALASCGADGDRSIALAGSGDASPPPIPLWATDDDNDDSDDDDDDDNDDSDDDDDDNDDNDDDDDDDDDNDDDDDDDDNDDDDDDNDNDDNDDNDDDDDDDDDNDDNDDDDDDDASPADDDDDNDDDDASPPPGCIQGDDFLPYWGNLHGHTSYSDGEGVPADAFAHARDLAGLDIMIVTDHLEHLYRPDPNDRWGLCRQQADAAYAPGDYLADCGYEYGMGYLLPWMLSSGHASVYFCPYLLPRYQLDFHDFYDSLAACEGAIGQFNHPGRLPTQVWNDFEYVAAVDQAMNLFEFNSFPAWPLFFEALDNGWLISPTYNQDNHDASWGTMDDNRSGFFLTDLTREALHDAMRDRRSFATTDKNAFVAVKANDLCWMGSNLDYAGPLTLAVEAFDLDASDGFTHIDLYGGGGALLATSACAGGNLCLAEFDVDASAAGYFVAGAVQNDGDLLLAAPVWTQ